ncbi:hypothetical protein BD413DRAFT_603656 [Trametes elegans]|nr:hypothetical protein BD413DRAFT_603656 [Trametes elegans]
MPPHRALSCYDVLYAVFENFECSEDAWYDYDPRTDDSHAWYSRRLHAVSRTTLARCARVCRAFFHPAVSILWKDIDDLSSLLAVLRTIPLLAKPTHSSYGDSYSGQVLPCMPEQMARAYQYAWRVRVVSGTRGTLASRADHHLPLPSGMREQALLPRLRHLRWIQSVPGNVDLLGFVPTTLESLHVVFRPRPPNGSESGSRRSVEESVRDLMRRVAIQAPQLRYLRVTTSGVVREGSLDWSLPRLRQLETFDILDPIYSQVSTHPLLSPLAALPNLRHLKLRLQHGRMPHIHPHTFPALRTLTLDAMFAPLSAVPAFLLLISSPHLRSLSLLHCECATAAVHVNLHDITDIICSKFRSSLRQFQLSLRGIGPVREDPQPLMKTLEPLLEMHSLDDVRIAIAPEVAVVASSHDDLKRMSESWPNTTRLHMDYHPSACPPLYDLAGVARGCVVLADLVLPGLDASAAGLEGALGADASALSGLRSFSLADGGWHSSIPDPERLAACLDRLCPNVDWRCPRLASEPWRETVQALVQRRIARMPPKSSGT